MAQGTRRKAPAVVHEKWNYGGHQGKELKYGIFLIKIRNPKSEIRNTPAVIQYREYINF